MSPCRILIAFLAAALSARAAVVDFDDQDLQVVTPPSRARAGGVSAGQGAKWEQKFNIAQIDLLVSTARRFFDEGNYEAAIENLLRADGELPFNAIINLAISQTYASMEAFDRAVLYGNRVITYEPRNPAGYLMLGYCYLELENYPQAQSIYETLLDFDPNQVDALSGLAHALGSQGNVDEAIRTYRKAVALQPNSSYLHEMLGNVLCAKGLREEAVKVYEKALRISPKSVEVLNALGAAHFAMGGTNQAVEVFNRALQIEPQNAKIYRNLAGVLTAAKNYPAALQVLMASIQIEFNAPAAWQHMLRVYLHVLKEQEPDWTIPDPPADLPPGAKAEWHRTRAMAELEQKKIARCGQHLIHSILLDDTDARTFNDFGSLLAAHFDKRYSVPFFQAAQVVDPSFVPARTNLRIVLASLEADNRERRIAELVREVGEHPNDPLRSFELARLYAVLNQVTNALPHFARAVSLDPTNTVARLDYAQALFVSGKEGDAAEQVRAALDLAPDDPMIQYRRAWMLTQKGEGLARDQRAEALDLLARANLATRYLDPNFLRTWAQASFLSGQAREAVEIAAMAEDRAEELEMTALAGQIRTEAAAYQTAPPGAAPKPVRPAGSPPAGPAKPGTPRRP